MTAGSIVPRVPFSDGWIRIRPIGPPDVLAFFEAFEESRATLDPWMHWGDGIQDESSARCHLESKLEEWNRGESCSFAVESASDGAFLGMCGFSQFNWRHRFANVGYWVRPSIRGRGITPIAVRLLARFGFDVLSLNRAEILIEPSNQASRRVAEKIGARLEGLLRARIQNRDEARDALMYSLIASIRPLLLDPASVGTSKRCCPMVPFLQEWCGEAPSGCWMTVAGLAMGALRTVEDLEAR